MSVQAETVTAPTMPEMVAGATSGVNRLGNQAATTNVSGLLTQLGGIFALLDSQGVFAQNPQLRAQFDALQSSVDKGTKGKTKKLTQAESKLTDAQSKKADIESRLASGSLTDKERQKLEKQLAKVDANITKFQQTSSRLSTEINNQYGRLDAWKEGNLEGARTGADMLREQFPELQRTLDEAAPYLDRMGQPGATGERLMEALGQGYTANTLGGPTMYRPDQVQAVNAARVGDVRAQQVGAGTLGNTLLGRAQQMAQSDGRLSPEANRDAAQAARQAFAARGLGTSAGSAAAELLNRDRYSRQRMFQDLGFAQGIQSDDVDRQIRNAQNTLTGDIANQGTAANLSMSDQRAAMDAQRFNQMSNQQANEFFQSEEGRRFIANEEARRLGNQQNIGMLGQAFTTDRMINQEGLGAALQRGQLESAANPANMMLGMYSAGQPTGTQALGPATSLANTWATNAANVGMFNANSNMWANAANQYGNYGGQSGGTGAMIGSIAGGLLGGAAGYFASSGNPMFAMGGYAAGSQIGGAAGGQFR
jgi:hypothetical protein